MPDNFFKDTVDNIFTDTVDNDFATEPPAPAVPQTAVTYIPVTTCTFDIEDLVERLDPDRHEPTIVYNFPNGRKFVTPEGAEYP